MTKRFDAHARHVLFVTRRFPPSVGGMQTLAADVDRTLRSSGATVERVALGSESTLHLVWFLPFAFLRTLVARRRTTHVVCGDVVAWAAVGPATVLSGAETAVMVHGLDVVFSSALYQRLVVRWALPRAGRLIANSAATKAVVSEKAAMDPVRIAVVNPTSRPPGEAPSSADARAELARRVGIDRHDGALILTTIGRLVQRKGVEWFVEHVFPSLPDETFYLVAGDGPRRQAIADVISRMSPDGRVKLLGRIDADYREVLLRGADICVLPNIAVSGDMEGFGIAAVEAATRRTLALASGIEGVTDAVVDGVTGVTVEAENPRAFIDAIETLAHDRERLRRLSERFAQEARARFCADDGMEGLLEAVGL